ncbi:Sigma factor regulator N-terminal [Paenibacillus sp. 1_12]|uniref:anti-sigma factor n=1 Tax=Paenibacillus sp. 1_12 TaxID=1566278 RepID=UPI0008ED95B1|nr:anti-sigma factor [Paenibacillus sp. 1_12]SFL58183.1 Sigma factor regulator N-terminal [Paenibacillus sp. 1_12]
MSEEFKRQLQDYAEGKLKGSEKEQLEKELNKMEAYQTYLNEFIGNDEDPRQLREGSAPIFAEASLLRRSKWKARLQTALTAIGIVILISLVSVVLTGLYYGLGNRAAIYQDVISSAIALTRPNLSISGSSNSNAFFTMDYKGTLRKKIGSTESSIGDFHLSFLLGWPGVEQTTWRNETSSSSAYLFQIPKAKQTSTQNSEWIKLDKLPEGSVSEIFVSLDRMYATNELLKLLESKNMDPVWFAAYTDQEMKHGNDESVMSPVGFPFFPIWHADDMKVTSHTEQKTGWFSKIVTTGSSSPGLETYGDGEVREQNFLDTLHLLQKHPSISKQLAPWLQLDAAVQYIDTHGVKLYGVVLTGPTKELLKLKEESWVSSIRIGEVRFWNWIDR